VHVAQDVDGSGTEGLIDVEMDLRELFGLICMGRGVLLRKVMNWKR
jgi:hypothetical protein